jgi:hypothetical protein
MRLHSLIAVSVLFLNIVSASASLANRFDPTFNLGGRIYTDHYFTAYSSPQYATGVLQSSISAWFEFQGNLTPTSSIFAVGQLDSFLRSLGEPNQSSFSARMREGYYAFQNSSFELRIGQQIIPWGKSDGVNPTDFFTAKDFTLMNPDEEVKRIGAPSIMISFTPNEGASPINLIGVFQATYPQTKLIIPDRVTRIIPSGISFQKYPNSPGYFQQDSVEFGGKFAYLGNDLDLSVSAFRGMNHFAQYVYRFNDNSISPQNIQQTVIGGDLSFTAGSSVVRAETAYFIPDQGPENTELYGLVQPSHWDSIVGIEKTFFDHIHTQVQFLYRYFVGYLNPNLYTTPNPMITQLQQGIARSNALLLNFQRQSNPGATFRVGYSSDDSDWTADLFLIGYFAQGQDYLLRPQVTFKPFEGMKLIAGADLYGGEESRPLGALRLNSSIFFEGRYLF